MTQAQEAGWRAQPAVSQTLTHSTPLRVILSLSNG
jgi:hypothetical protein